MAYACITAQKGVVSHSEFMLSIVPTNWNNLITETFNKLMMQSSYYLSSIKEFQIAMT